MSAEEVAWAAELDNLEDVLKKAIAQRVKPCNSDKHTLKLAFQSVDFDEMGKPADSGSVSYHEFVAALERFGLYASQAVYGLFDRYNVDGGENLNYAAFSEGLYGTKKPFPPPPRRGAGEATRPRPGSAELLRDAPPNRWANSAETGSPNRRPVRVLSLANPKHRSQAAPKWKQVSTTHFCTQNSLVANVLQFGTH